MWNPITINTDKTLYIAIAEAIERDVRNGVLKPGQKMPTHRELADIIGVNVTTITRAYKEAERRGIVTGTVGRGTFVTADLGLNSSILQVEEKYPKTQATKLIELGLVLTLYQCEPDLAPIVAKLSRDKQLNRFLRYSDPLGMPEHRQTGAEWVKRFGLAVNSDQIVICAGAQHALTCCFQSLFEAGDRVAVDCLTYPGVKAVAKAAAVRLEPIAMDGEGMIPESLEAACGRQPLQGVYLMPNMQNPTATGMSAARKEALAEIIIRHHLILIEDDIYSFSNPDDQGALTALCPQSGIYIASLSKTFYAGLRVAYVAAPRQFLLKIGQAVVNTIWMAPTLNAAIASECIRDGSAPQIMAVKLAEITDRVRIAREMLPGELFTAAPAGFYIWLKLPEGWTGKEFELTCRENGVNVFCAEKFAVGGEAAPPAARLSLSGAETTEELREGLTILNRVLTREPLKLETIL